MEKVNDQVGTVQNTLEKIRSKTTMINRVLKTVDREVASMGPQSESNLLAFEEIAGVAPLLAATEEE